MSTVPPGYPMNTVPPRYRVVAVTRVGVPLRAGSLRAHFLGRPAYRATRYIVALAGDQAALVEVDKAAGGQLFSEVTAVRLLAGPGETRYVRSAGTDVGIPSQLASAAAEHAPAARCVIVEGRYSHVSFILDPSPLAVRVAEVAPPWPPKLLDQARRVLDLAEDLPPVELVPQVTDIADLARQRPSGHYLMPCRGSGTRVDGARVSFLDEVPPRSDWTLVGPARSREIYRWLYGEDPATVEMCPRELARREPIPPGAVVLTKCCMRQEGIETDGRTVVVPWGATLAEVREGLAAAVDIAGREVAAPVP